MIDQDHHHLPQFYLKAWGDRSGRVPYLRWLDGRLLTSDTTPRHTGYVTNLYAQENVPLEHKHVYETKFFKTLDTKASEVLPHLISGQPFRPNPDQRVWWSAFLLAAHLRIPERIVQIKASASTNLIAELEKDPEEVQAVLGDDSLREWVETHMIGVIENFGLHTMANFVTNHEQIRKISDLYWSGHSFPESHHELITGDRPLLVFGDDRRGDFVMLMALSPRRLFVASQSREFPRTIIGANHTEAVRTFNTWIIERADERVYGRIGANFVRRIFESKSIGTALLAR